MPRLLRLRPAKNAGLRSGLLTAFYNVVASMPHVYILECSDGSYYVGSTPNLGKRLAQHQTGFFGGYTASRLPVQLVWSEKFPTDNDAFLRERQIKGWSRAKKEALIRGDWNGLHEVVKKERQTREKKKRKAQKAPAS